MPWPCHTSHYSLALKKSGWAIAHSFTSSVERHHLVKWSLLLLRWTVLLLPRFEYNKGTCARGGAEHRGWGVLSEPGSVDPEVGEQSVGLKERAPAGSEDA